MPVCPAALVCACARPGCVRPRRRFPAPPVRAARLGDASHRPPDVTCRRAVVSIGCNRDNGKEITMDARLDYYGSSPGSGDDVRLGRVPQLATA